MTQGIDSSLASVAPVAAAEDRAAISMAEAPPLAWMTGFAALADLAINRVLIKLGHDTWSNDALFRLYRAGTFALNLSVVAGLVVLVFCLGSFSSRRSGLPLSARVGIAGFGWVLMPIVAMMTLLPLPMTRPELVLVVAGLAHAVVLLLILAGLHWRSTGAMIATLVLTLVASLSGAASMVVQMVGRRFFWAQTQRLANAFHWSGELAYLIVPLAAAFVLAIAWGTTRGKAALALSTFAAALVAIEMGLLRRVVGDELPTFLYGAIRLDLLPDRYSVLYAIPLAVGWAVTVAAALSKDAARRQLGAGLMLLLSVGYAPRTPSTLILTVVGVALLTRTGIALAKRQA